MTTIPTLREFINLGSLAREKGPLAIIFAEDEVAIAPTLMHHQKCGFHTILVLSAVPLSIEATPESTRTRIINLRCDPYRANNHADTVNQVIDAVPANTWLYYCYNSEFLFFPFSDTRTVGEMLTFHAEERRRAMLTYVIDLYAPDLSSAPNAVDLQNAMLDKTGYYALGRRHVDGSISERQLDFFGGLRWRYEEHIPQDRRRIDRIALFRTQPGLRLLPDHRFNVEEYNTYSCPWHHNLTASIMSFRVAKALIRNPGSRAEIRRFTWHNSIPFQWKSQQLMDLGLMEPGQWF